MARTLQAAIRREQNHNRESRMGKGVYWQSPSEYRHDLKQSRTKGVRRSWKQAAIVKRYGYVGWEV